MSVKVHTEKSGFTRQLPTHLCTVLPEVGLNRLRVREAPGGSAGASNTPESAEADRGPAIREHSLDF
jgi:hypothetical protein